MNTRPTLHFLNFFCLAALLLTPLAAQPGFAQDVSQFPTDAAPAFPQAGGEIVLVARDVIDLKWEPSGYPASPGKFKRWELHRGPTLGSLSKITSGVDQTTGFYRDKDREVNTTYSYRLYVVRCVDPCLTDADEIYLTYFEDSVTTGVFAGTLYRSLELGDGVYEIGFNDITSSAVVNISNGSSLVITSKTIVTKKPDISHGAIYVKVGNLSASGAVLASVSVTVGDYGGSESNCMATFDNVNITAPSFMVNASCRLDITGIGGIFNVFASDNAGLTITNALVDGGIDIEKHAVATLSGNTITGRIEVSGYHDPDLPKPKAYLYKNVIKTPYKYNQGVLVDYGATVYMGENVLGYTGHVDSETAILIQAWDIGTTLVAMSNRIENAKIFLANNPTVNITDNVLVGNGAAITVGCPFCGTGPQATGPVEKNTLQSGWGVEMWDGSQSVTLRHNCIRDNTPGLTAVNSLPVNLDAKENYWGSASGPRHSGNPAGTGDEIVGSKVDYTPWDQDPTNCREEAPHMRFDLYPIGLEVVQTVQTMQNTVPLAADNPTWVRVYAQSSRGPVANVNCVLHGFRGTTPIGTITAIKPNITVQPPTALTTLRENQNLSWNFNLPPAWIVAGDLHLVAEINPGGTIIELIPENNTIERSVSFTPRRTMRVAFVPVRYHTLVTDDLPVQNQILPMMLFMQRMYPISDIQGEIIAAPMEWTGIVSLKALQNIYDSEIKDRLNTRFNLFNANRPPEQRIDQIYGVFPNSAGLSFCSSDPLWFGGKGRTAYCIIQDVYLPHEIGHNLGLRHPNTADACGAADSNTDWPFNNATIQDVGVDVLSRMIKPSSNHDLMTYCPNPPSWISPFSATKIFNADGIPQPAVQSPEAEVTYLFVRGKVDTAGTVTLSPSWQLNMISPPLNPPAGSAYCIDLRNSTNVTLTSYCFDPQFSIYESGDTVDTTTFEVGLPMVTGAVKVAVRKFGDPVPIAQTTASAHPPSVAVLYPNGGENLSGSVTVSWQGTDPDMDTLFYHLLFSRDGGATWLPIVEYLTTTTYTLDTSSLPGGAGGRFRVIASDGFHSSQDDSNGSFTSPDNPPLIGIGRPDDGSQGLLPLSLSGAGYDLEEGMLPDNQLTWTSDVDGLLGTGANLVLDTLSLGLHNITLTASDSQGHTATYTIKFTVLEPRFIFLPILKR